ncbi:protein of unknown function [Candidatus Nitrotoga arctica]|uniref:Uncharacterized protein n=1 Tax=Candidatus Nitrotoga arctica TaxID=453162 RepID=A0ABM8YZY0_9PROT|nr:protein of unknown function [Candidatus Nitrotoga arctica]
MGLAFRVEKLVEQTPLMDLQPVLSLDGMKLLVLAKQEAQGQGTQAHAHLKVREQGALAHGENRVDQDINL